MPNPYSMELRTRAVAAYEAGEGSYVAIAEQFAISVSSLLRWVDRTRTTGDVAPRPKGGGWHSPIDPTVLRTVIAERPDATAEELRRMYNRRVARGARVSRSSVVRALRRLGYVLKKTAAPE
jgi:putative transposase